MKVSKYLEKSFNPITLKIVFETQTEFDAFKWAMSFNETLPEIVYGKDQHKASMLEETMTKIHDEMRKSL